MSEVFSFFNAENEPYTCRSRSFIIHELRYLPMTASHQGSEQIFRNLPSCLSPLSEDLYQENICSLQ